MACKQTIHTRTHTHKPYYTIHEICEKGSYTRIQFCNFDES